MVTWALSYLGGARNSTFPARAILKAHEICSYYFNISFTQVSRNPQLWYYISNVPATGGTYMFTRKSGQKGIHFPYNVNYGGEGAIKSVSTGIRHELGHFFGKDSHNNSPTSLMYYALNSNILWEPSDLNGWFNGWGMRAGRYGWAAGEMSKWFPAGDYGADNIVRECGCEACKPTLMDRFSSWFHKPEAVWVE